MHLFITQPVITDSMIQITEERLLHQMSRVLRMQPGERCAIQSQGQQTTVRRTIMVNDLSSKLMTGTIVEEVTHSIADQRNIGMVVALPNSMAKADLIVQKLTEVGVDAIYFRRAERSQIKEISINRLERLQKIALEATEQSWGWTVPEIACVSPEVIQGKYDLCVVFDQDGETTFHENTRVQSVLGVVGPEGGFSDNDLHERKSEKTFVYSLGKTVLRMETAAIIGGRHAVNTFS